MKSILRFIILFIVVATHFKAMAQSEAGVAVPDLAGMNEPQAAAALSIAGLRLGDQTQARAGSSQIPDTVIAQIPTAGTQVEAGSAVDITIARAPNMRLLYDNNDMTLINLSGQDIALGSFVLRQIGGDARFRGERWGAQVRAGDCVQVWSVARTAAKAVDGCGRVNSWLTTNDPAQHVWTASSGVERFAVARDGEVLAECEAAPRRSQDTPSMCEFYIPGPAAAAVLPYVYLAYTEDALIVRNPSEDQWLRLNVDIVPAQGEALTLSHARQYDAVDALVLAPNGNVRQLAPNQCVRFRTLATAPDTLPQPCLMFGDRIMELPFWTSDFVVRGRDDQDRTCAAATSGRLTICIMPR